MRHLVHIGCPKAASQFLGQWFERHPQLLYKNHGLAGFQEGIFPFADKVARHRKQPYAYAVTSWEGFSSGSLGWLLGRSNDWQLDPEIFCDFLADFFPNARILIITRGFASRVISTYKQLVKMRAVDDFDAIMGELSGRDFIYFDYNKLIGMYEQAFGKENVIVLPYELLRDDNVRFLAILQEKLGLDPVEYNPGVVNDAASPSDLYWSLKLNKLLVRTKPVLGATLFDKLNAKHIHNGFYNRYRPLFRVLSAIFPNRKLLVPPLPESILEGCRGRADILKGREEYKNYGAEYLWE
jgi:hypothetical protein